MGTAAPSMPSLPGWPGSSLPFRRSWPLAPRLRRASALEQQYRRAQLPQQMASPSKRLGHSKLSYQPPCPSSQLWQYSPWPRSLPAAASPAWRRRGCGSSWPPGIISRRAAGTLTAGCRHRRMPGADPHGVEPPPGAHRRSEGRHYPSVTPRRPAPLSGCPAAWPSPYRGRMRGPGRSSPRTEGQNRAV